MGNDTYKVQILIPTCNSAKQIDATMQSIYKQTVGMDNIYVTIMDFASTDDTFQQLLTYDSFHLGIYQYPKQVNKEYRISRMSKMLSLFSLGHRTYYMGLFPGAMIYPDFINRCVNLLENKKSEDVSTVICEADILKSDGSVFCQQPLYSMSLLLQQENRLEFLKKNYCHQIIWISKNKFISELHFSSNSTNNLNDWYCQFYKNHLDKVIYIPENLGALPETYCDNKLELLMIDHAVFAGFIRTFENDVIISPKEKEEICERFAYLSLRKALQALQEKNEKEAEDCILFSEIFWGDICSTDIYQQIKRNSQADVVILQEMERLLIEKE